MTSVPTNPSAPVPSGGDAPLGVDSEVGRLRTVMLHRPGPELSRLTPRNNDRLLFDGIPWVGRAQQEHDAFAAALRERGVEVLYLTELLTEALAVPDAREETIAAVLADPRLGDSLRRRVGAYLRDLDPEALAAVLTGGLAHEELNGGRGLVFTLMDRHEFVIDPLPNLLFTRDSSVWVRDRVAVTSLAMPARVRETTLTRAIYTYHPRFARVEHLYEPGWEPVEGGDVLLLAPGVLAVGTGERTTPAGVERLARRVFASRGGAHRSGGADRSGAGDHAPGHGLHDGRRRRRGDVSQPGRHMTALTVTLDGDDVHVAAAEPFLVAAAKAMGIDTLRVIDTGLDPVTAEREQWDDGNNTLALAPRLAVAYERNIETNARLEEADIEVIAISGSELGSGRGGPRCMSCPMARDSLAGV